MKYAVGAQVGYQLGGSGSVRYVQIEGAAFFCRAIGERFERKLGRTYVEAAVAQLGYKIAANKSGGAYYEGFYR